MKSCLKCGAQNKDDAKFCVGCGQTNFGQVHQQQQQQPQYQQQQYQQPYQPPKKKKKALKVILIVLGAIIALSIIGNLIDGPPSEADTTTTTAASLDAGATDDVAENIEATDIETEATTVETTTEATTTAAETREEFIASCEAVDIRDVRRNPQNFTGKRVAITGEVSQYLSGGVLSEEAFTIYEDYDFGSEEYDTFLERRWYIKYTQPETDRILEDDIVTFYGVFDEMVELTTVLGADKETPRVEGVYHEIIG